MGQENRDQYHKGYTHGYFAGYRDARRDMENGIDRLDIESELLSHPIETMGLSVRAYNCLYLSGLRYIGEVTTLTAEQIVAMRNLGMKTRNEVAHWLDGHGLTYTAWNTYL